MLPAARHPDVQCCVHLTITKVTTASRSELGGTRTGVCLTIRSSQVKSTWDPGKRRKYSGGTDDRVQTAAAFVTLLRELGEDVERKDDDFNASKLA